MMNGLQDIFEKEFFRIFGKIRGWIPWSSIGEVITGHDAQIVA